MDDFMMARKTYVMKLIALANTHSDNKSKAFIGAENEWYIKLISATIKL